MRHSPLSIVPELFIRCQARRPQLQAPILQAPILQAPILQAPRADPLGTSVPHPDSRRARESEARVMRATRAR